jgi:hypothetical protein
LLEPGLLYPDPLSEPREKSAMLKSVAVERTDKSWETEDRKEEMKPGEMKQVVQGPRGDI